ncbi:MAG: site-specific integrase [Alphaproteobacteria bacterium]
MSISLKTRCPKEALRLANMLEYHSLQITKELNGKIMDYAELQAIFKDHFAKLLHVHKNNMDEFGPLSKKDKTACERTIALMDKLIENEQDSLPELDEDMDKSIANINELYELGIEPDSDEYQTAKKLHKYAIRSLHKDILSYHQRLTDFSVLDASKHPEDQTAQPNKPQYQLQNVIEKYVLEITGSMTDKSLGELTTCLRYLTELLGSDFNITKLDGEKARYVKDCLLKTPARRNTKKETRDLPLLEQIEVKGLAPFAPRTINKYLEYFSGLLKWSINNNYIKENPFEGMSVKDSKDGKREDFNDGELALIFAELDKGKAGLAKDDLRYWSTLIFLYTGARRNEIASLTTEDVKYDAENDIHYFQIKDEKKSKRKNKDVFRLVPVHSDLINRGFLKYVEKVKSMKRKNLRLLHQLTFTKGHDWGKKLTYWFSKVLLPKLEIKRPETSLHSTRHTFITRIKETDTEYAIIDAMVGHEGKGTGETVYTHRSERHLPVFRDAIEKLAY